MSTAGDLYDVTNFRHPNAAGIVPIGEVDPTAGAMVNPNAAAILSSPAALGPFWTDAGAMVRWTDAAHVEPNAVISNSDTFAATADLSTVNYIENEDENFHTFKNLHLLPALKEVWLFPSGNGTPFSVTAFPDFSQNPLIKTVLANKCESITNPIDVSGHVHLTDLDLGSGDDFVFLGVQSPSLNVTGCVALESLSTDQSAITSLDLHTCVSLQFLRADASALTSLNLAGCSSMQDLNVGSTGIASLNLLTCTTITTIKAPGCVNLITVTLPTGAGVASIVLCDLSGCALNQAAVDGVLSALANFGTAGGELHLDGGTNGVPTDGESNADYIALQGSGWTVTINT